MDQRQLGGAIEETQLNVVETKRSPDKKVQISQAE
jgi:hypothetical protein